MKTKLFVASLLSFLFAANVNSATLREIILKSKPYTTPRLEAPKNVSEINALPDTYVIGNSVIVDFPSETDNVSVLVTNNETGEIVHQELVSSFTATTLYIDLNACGDGAYSIDVASTKSVLVEEISIK